MFAPNSEYLVFYSSHGGTAELWSVSLDETEYNKLTTSSGKGGWEFSDDGKRLYYTQAGRLSYLEMSGSSSKSGGSVSVSSQVAYDQHEIWDRCSWKVGAICVIISTTKICTALTGTRCFRAIAHG